MISAIQNLDMRFVTWFDVFPPTRLWDNANGHSGKT